MAKKHAGGRPEKVVDIEQVRRCAEVGCTDEEIADICGISDETLRKRKFRAEFLGVLKNARCNLRMSLRRSQVVAALGGNVTAQIWLGKNMLGQRDKFDVSLESTPIEALEAELVRLQALVDKDKDS
jgi:hypothetical protein